MHSSLVRPREGADKLPLIEVAELGLWTAVLGARLLDDDENGCVRWADAAPSEAAAFQEHNDTGEDFANRKHRCGAYCVDGGCGFTTLGRRERVLRVIRLICKLYPFGVVV
jgi:hypothetical protein